MSCETARLLMENNDPGLAEHLNRCPSCLIGANAAYCYEAPGGLEQAIRRSLRAETAAFPYWRWAAAAAVLLLTVSLAINVRLFQSRVSTGQADRRRCPVRHVRSLAGDHLLDVPSSDQHTVKPWFNGKVDFSPPVKTLQGFPLVGGRLEYFDGHPAAALIYERGKHIINLFLWPSDAAPERIQTRNGYHMQSWFDNGMAFWAVSDLNVAELREFVALFRQGEP